jgi:hypothetical protein
MLNLVAEFYRNTGRRERAEALYDEVGGGRGGPNTHARCVRVRIPHVCVRVRTHVCVRSSRTNF